jgi:hypothetical protein
MFTISINGQTLTAGTWRELYLVIKDLRASHNTLAGMVVKDPAGKRITKSRLGDLAIHYMNNPGLL